MSKITQIQFQAELRLIGINPFVFIPDPHLSEIFKQIGREKGNIKLLVSANGGDKLPQTLMKYRDEWRLYINTKILKNSPKRIGEYIDIKIELDYDDRTIPMPPELKDALKKNFDAHQVYQNLIPSLQKEINRYIANLKTQESIDLNVKRAIDFLLGKGKFIGRSSINMKKTSN